MKKYVKAVCAVMALTTALGVTACKNKDTGAIKLTIWVSESDKAFATKVVDEFKAKNPDMLGFIKQRITAEEMVTDWGRRLFEFFV